MNLSTDSNEIVANSPECEALDFIIAVRNEESKIGACLKSIQNQDWLPDLCRVFVVNDHSEDDTKHVLNLLKPSVSKMQLHCIDLDRHELGKKAAIKAGLRKVNAPIIIQLDGDVELDRRVVKVLALAIESQKIDACFGEVRYFSESQMSKFLALENLNNQCVTEAFMNAQKPLLSNGAVMAMRREVVDIYTRSLTNNISSGDDAFFIEELRSAKKKMKFSRDAMVFTEPPEDIKSLTAQRIRWSGKTKAAKQFEVLLVAGVVFSIQAIFVSSLILLPFTNGMIWIVLFWFLKWLTEYFFQRIWFSQRQVKLGIFQSIILSMVYPFYTTSVGFIAMIWPKVEWKGRLIK